MRSSTRVGDFALELAPIWFEYGNALLCKEEETPTDELLGAAAEEAKKNSNTSQTNDMNDDDEDDDIENVIENTAESDSGANVDPSLQYAVRTESATEEADGENIEQEPDTSDMEIAWEALEVENIYICLFTFSITFHSFHIIRWQEQYVKNIRGKILISSELRYDTFLTTQ